MAERIETLHATSIAVGGRAALIRGPSGAGKSDLALRCLAVEPRFLNGGMVELVSDDQTVVAVCADGVQVSPPPALRGLIEVRGVGIVRCGFAALARLELVVDLVPRPEDVARYPEQGVDVPILGCSLRHMKLYPFEASAPLKLLLALAGETALSNG